MRASHNPRRFSSDPSKLAYSKSTKVSWFEPVNILKRATFDSPVKRHLNGGPMVALHYAGWDVRQALVFHFYTITFSHSSSVL